MGIIIQTILDLLIVFYSVFMDISQSIIIYFPLDIIQDLINSNLTKGFTINTS